MCKQQICLQINKIRWIRDPELSSQPDSNGNINGTYEYGIDQVTIPIPYNI